VKAPRTVVVLLALVALVTSALRAAPVVRATSYTSDQAWQGRLAYYRSCAECHGGKLEGVFGPALAGGNDNLQYQSVSGVYDYMAAHMPHGNPESLPEGEYVAIMAFLMQSHGLAPGPRPLTKAAIEADVSLLGNGR
jgi:mono/diheme cytochrome c family protein